MRTRNLAQRHYAIELLNRRIAQRLENVNRTFADITGESGVAALRCACGRDDCSEVITVPLADYQPISDTTHSFVVAPGHATEIDTVLDRREGYDLIEIKPQYRLAQPGRDIPPTEQRA